MPMLTFEAIQAFLEYFPSHISDLHSGETVAPQIESLGSTFRQPQRPLWIASLFFGPFDDRHKKFQTTREINKP